MANLGALIFLVNSKGGYDGLAILKIFPESQSEEISLQIKACNEGGSFSHLQFPSIARKHASENWSAVLMTVAGDGLQYVDPLSDVSEVERTKAIGSVLRGYYRSGTASQRQQIIARPLRSFIIG